MKLFVDENIPMLSVRLLRADGHDVLAVAETMPAAADRVVLARANAEDRLLITFDRDFGALAFARGIPAPAGIVLLRFAPASPDEPAAVLRDLFDDAGLQLRGRFTVVDRERVRQRPLSGEGAGA